MRQTLFQEKYPIYTLEIDKSETSFTSVDMIIEHLKGKIDAHPVVAYIGVFDHYAHTSGLKDGVISEKDPGGQESPLLFRQRASKPGSACCPSPFNRRG